MLYREIVRILGVMFVAFAAVLLIPLLLALYYQLSYPEVSYQGIPVAKDFLIAVVVSLVLGGILWKCGGQSKGVVYRREGIAAVVLIWFLIPALSALPLLTSGTIKNPFQAYFEMVSGFTTTGMSIMHAKKYDSAGKEIPIEYTVPGVIPVHYSFYGTITPFQDAASQKIIKEGVEAVSKPLLFWRSFTQWLGGGGIIVLFVAILPALGVGGKLLYQMEVSSQTSEGLTPRIKETAIQLWKIYLLLTLLQVGSLMATNHQLPLFEAVAVSFSTISTGGFSTQSSSIAGYHNVATEWVVIIFMILGSISFSLYYFLLKGNLYRLLQPELATFLVLLILFSGFSIATLGNAEPARASIFQLVSAQSSTGFFTSNYDIWPYPAQLLLIIAMYVGGMAGSTAGGIKVIRNIILFRSAQYRAESLFRPEQVRIFKVGSKEIGASTTLSVLCFFLVVIATSVLSTVLYVYDGIDPETAFSLTSCMLNNTGMGFRMAGSEFSCAFLSNFSLLLSSFLMIFGRLEYFAVLAFLIPSFWNEEA